MSAQSPYAASRSCSDGIARSSGCAWMPPAWKATTARTASDPTASQWPARGPTMPADPVPRPTESTLRAGNRIARPAGRSPSAAANSPNRRLFPLPGSPRTTATTGRPRRNASRHRSRSAATSRWRPAKVTATPPGYDKHPYGWVCRFCADELDRYYLLLMGLRGGTIAKLFAEDARSDAVPMRENEARARAGAADAALVYARSRRGRVPLVGGPDGCWNTRSPGLDLEGELQTRDHST